MLTSRQLPRNSPVFRVETLSVITFSSELPRFTMKNAKAIFALVLVGTLIYTVYMIAPCYFSNWQFQDDIASLAKFPGTMDDEALRLDAVKKAAAHGILLTSDQILVVREGN